MLKRNLVTNLAGRGTSMLLQAALLPLYLHILGIEAVGLIGFYNTMVIAFGVAEYAIGTMVMREMAVLTENEDGAQVQRDLLRTTETVYVFILLTVGAGVSLAAPAIVRIWLSKSSLDHLELDNCVRLMGWTVAVQLFGSLYVNVLNGLERQFHASILAVALVSARGASALLALFAISASIEAYFISQLFATILVFAASAIAGWRALPRASPPPQISPKLLLATWRQGRSLTGAAVLFVALSQADKLIASSLLPLKDFGAYVIASMIASMMFSVYGSVGTALVPRFARLIVLHADKQLANLFHLASQIVCLLLVPVATLIVFSGKELVLLWTGNAVVASQVAPIAALLSTGVLLVCLACASNSLQLAAGFYELNLLNNVIWIIGLPITFLATTHYGAIGAASMWLIAGLINLGVAPNILHQRMLKDQKMRWYFRDLAIPTLSSIAVGGISTQLLAVPTSQVVNGLQLIGVWIASAITILLVCPDLRRLAISTSSALFRLSRNRIQS